MPRTIWKQLRLPSPGLRRDVTGRVAQAALCDGRVDHLGCICMAPRHDREAPDERPLAQGRSESPRGKDVIRPPSKEQREAALAKMQAINDKYTSREPAANATPAPHNPAATENEPVPESDLLMLDPSFVFSAEGTRWLREEPRVRNEEIVVSSA